MSNKERLEWAVRQLDLVADVLEIAAEKWDPCLNNGYRVSDVQKSLETDREILAEIAQSL